MFHIKEAIPFMFLKTHKNNHYGNVFKHVTSHQLLKFATVDRVAHSHLLEISDSVLVDQHILLSRSFVAWVIEKSLWQNVGLLSTTVVWLV